MDTGKGPGWEEFGQAGMPWKGAQSPAFIAKALRVPGGGIFQPTIPRLEELTDSCPEGLCPVLPDTCCGC